jgi:hypothetical protein
MIPMSETATPSAPTWLELERVISLPEAMSLTNLSDDTLKKEYRHLIVRLSPRRVGMKMSDALAITRGNAKIT